MIQIFKNPEIEEVLIADIEVIEKTGEGLPYLIHEKSVHKDITYILDHFKGKVIKSYTPNLKEGHTSIFKKRRVYKVGINHDAMLSKNSERDRENEYFLTDSFIKVNGVEIY